MMRDLSFYKKANTLAEVDNAIRMDVPITADHPFYTDFSDVRGDFEDRMIYKTLNVHPRNFIYNREINRDNRTLLFLAGMRGSGKTSELAKITQRVVFSA
jgi:signal recognition particle GTPase